MNLGFQFKQFFVAHDRCAMKVGTDGVLLGAWAESAVSIQPSAFRILDVGTGSGLVALMLAQRFPEAHIDAIDIDKAAVEQAAENFAASPWSDRLHTFHVRLQDWQSHSVPSLIVSNPPYFQNSLKNPDKGRELARHTDTLSYEELLCHSARLLSEHGQLAIILPAEAEQEIRTLAAQHSLFTTRITRVYSKETKPARRVLLQFEKSEYRDTDISIAEDRLVLEDDKGTRSAAYQEITKDFYL
ncbi:MAG: methyltransferase [Paludibacteraceae bacterium]|nr:methyltransferase [Paludibacteraceae bacterium]